MFYVYSTSNETLFVNNTTETQLFVHFQGSQITVLRCKRQSQRPLVVLLHFHFTFTHFFSFSFTKAQSRVALRTFLLIFRLAAQSFTSCHKQIDFTSKQNLLRIRETCIFYGFIKHVETLLSEPTLNPGRIKRPGASASGATV